MSAGPLTPVDASRDEVELSCANHGTMWAVEPWEVIDLWVSCHAMPMKSRVSTVVFSFSWTLCLRGS